MHYFQFGGLSFWLSLKPFLNHFFIKKLVNSIYEIEFAKKFLLDNKLSSIIILSESGFTEQIMIRLAKKFSIKIILLQHGVMLDKSSAEQYNKIIGGNVPVDSDKFFVWGNTSAKCVLQSKCSSDKIEIKGSPNLDRIFQQKNTVKKSDYVLLLATGPRNQQYVGHNVFEWNKYENLIKKICAVVNNHNLKLIIKRHPDMAESDFSKNIFDKFSNVTILKHGEISDLLLKSKIIISVGVSSSIFEAQILEKPVISLVADHDVYGIPKSVSQSCLETKIDDFESNFSKLVKNNQFYQKTVQNANHFMRKNFNNIGKSSQIILEDLTEFE